MAKTVRKKTAGADNSATHVTDIPHEEVHQDGKTVSTETVAVQVITIDQQIKNELAKFNVAESGIAKLKEQYGGLVITGPEDKTGYKSVKEAWGQVRTVRTSLEKKGLELRKDYQVITKAISGEENRLVELVTPLEEDLYKKWKAIDDEKERAKKEQEEKEQAQLMARVEEIQTLGMTFVDGFYQIGGTISVDVASLRGFNDDQFAKLKGAITAKKTELDNAEAERLEQQRLDNEQRQKDAQKLRDDQKKLDDERAELDRQRKEIEDQRKDAARMKLENRSNQMAALGFKTKGDQFVWDNGASAIYVAHSSAENATPEEWRDKVAEVKQAILESTQAKEQHDAEKKREQEEKDRREKFIAESLTTVGMIYDYGRKLFHWTSKELDPIEATWNDFAGLDDAAIATKAHQLGDMITTAKQEENRIVKAREAEQKKQENLALSDRDRFFKDVARIEAAVAELSAANYKTKKFQQMAAQLRENLTQELENGK
jgi:hypothetical protein